MMVTAVGACTAVGLNAASAAAAVRAGVSTFGMHPYMVDSEGDPVMVAQVPGIDPSSSATERMSVLACTALRDVLESRPPIWTAERVPVVLSLPSDRPGTDPQCIQAVVDIVARELEQSNIRADIAIVRAGHAGGLFALRECRAALIKRGMPWGLVGGVESWLEPETIEWLEADERLHSAANPWGLIPGEGAAFSAVSDPANTPELRGGLATLGFGVASESVPRRGAEPCLGIGLTAAMQEALTSVPDGEQVDEMFCDCNGERDRAEEFGFAVIRVSDRFVDASAMRTPADCWGDVGCATGAMLLALSYQAAARGWLAGPNMLLWSSSDGPQRAAAALRAHFRQKEI